MVEVCDDPALFGRLLPLAWDEGFLHLARLSEDWIDGVNRFAAPGEVLLHVRLEGLVVACGGLTRQGDQLGRVRRVYVDPAYRRQGVGRVLIEALIDHARGSFGQLVLHTDNPTAARFYESMGFSSEDPGATEDKATHRLVL